MGEIAALATSFFWSLTSVQFTLAGQLVGSIVVNRVRLVLAVLFLSTAHLLLMGELWPLQAEGFRWAWLGLSGTVGLVLGDSCLFQSFVLIGTRRAMTLMTLAPVFGTLVAWLWLGETLQPLELGAVLLTVSSVAWVVSEKQAHQNPSAAVQHTDPGQQILGVALGVGGALGQALGLVLAKRGLVGDFHSLSATLIRMTTATGVIWLLTLVQGQAGATWHALRTRRASLFIASGSFTGPFIGVWLSMLAVQNTHVGIASTLMALSPIMLIPLSHRIFHEPISSRAVAGTLAALAGVAVILLT
jgi:drug/metabolite transporter (DMT)-like permease